MHCQSKEEVGVREVRRDGVEGLKNVEEGVSASAVVFVVGWVEWVGEHEVPQPPPWLDKVDAED